MEFEGLNNSLKNLLWSHSINMNKFFPRAYNLGKREETAHLETTLLCTLI